MNPQVKEKWLTALRSGKYKQTRKILRGNEGFCCLGVLCDIYSKETDNPWETRVWTDCNYGYEYVNVDESEASKCDFLYFYGEEEYLPQTVVEWAELKNNNPDVVDSDDTTISISRLNDNGVSFQEIADIIEKHL